MVLQLMELKPQEHAITNTPYPLEIFTIIQDQKPAPKLYMLLLLSR